MSAFVEAVRKHRAAISRFDALDEFAKDGRRLLNDPRAFDERFEAAAKEVRTTMDELNSLPI